MMSKLILNVDVTACSDEVIGALASVHGIYSIK